MFYYEQKRRDQLNHVKESLANSSADALPSTELVEFSDKPNVYFVLLESFFDPREFNDIVIEGEVIHPSLKKYLPESGRFDHIQVPVFGAGTAQSEFEILTGVPALQVFDSVEFNSLHGEKTYSICKQFTENHYKCEALVATGPNFYNSVEAYKSLCFDKVNYLNEPDSCLQLQQNQSEFPDDRAVLDALIDLKSTQKQPFFGYVVTMFGHRPYKRDLAIMPNVIKSAVPKIESKARKKRIDDCVNGVYYKTKSMGEFLDALYQEDPSAVVLLFSDHLPDVCREMDSTKRENGLHQAPALLLQSGKYQKIEVDTLYNLHHQVLSLLSHQKLNILSEDELRKCYLHVMVDAVK